METMRRDRSSTNGNYDNHIRVDDLPRHFNHIVQLALARCSVEVLDIRRVPSLPKRGTNPTRKVHTSGVPGVQQVTVTV
jgi:hypothetical protein